MDRDNILPDTVSLTAPLTYISMYFNFFPLAKAIKTKFPSSLIKRIVSSKLKIHQAPLCLGFVLIYSYSCVMGGKTVSHFQFHVHEKNEGWGRGDSYLENKSESGWFPMKQSSSIQCYKVHPVLLPPQSPPPTSIHPVHVQNKSLFSHRKHTQNNSQAHTTRIPLVGVLTQPLKSFTFVPSNDNYRLKTEKNTFCTCSCKRHAHRAAIYKTFPIPHH
jgi:hypothetical protein